MKSQLPSIEANGHTIEAVPFRQSLVSWGKEHFRAFPWRQTRDPYRLLLAEVMLHRTQARQVVPVYERFIVRFPDFTTLARADRAVVSSLLMPLGLHWRIALICAMVEVLTQGYGGAIPRSREDLLNLPGVSDYISSAVRCFAWEEPDPLVDTNTVRVMGRLFGITVKDSTRRNAAFRRTLASLVDPSAPAAYHYALLDLAASVCRKRQPPICSKCPVNSHCAYAQTNIWHREHVTTPPAG